MSRTTKELLLPYATMLVEYPLRITNILKHMMTACTGYALACRLLVSYDMFAVSCSACCYQTFHVCANMRDRQQWQQAVQTVNEVCMPKLASLDVQS